MLYFSYGQKNVLQKYLIGKKFYFPIYTVEKNMPFPGFWKSTIVNIFINSQF